MEKRPDSFRKQPTIWERFAARWPDHPALKAEAIYAIPERLVDAIQTEMPGFFTEQEEQFERDLARTSGSGFFLQQSFCYLGLTERHGEDEMSRSVRESAARISEMLEDDLRKKGVAKTQIAAWAAREEQMGQDFVEMQQSYAGWLVTSPDFAFDLGRVRNALGRGIQDRGRLPSMPWTISGQFVEGPSDERESEWYDVCNIFFRRWALDGMATFELPIPMRVEFATPSLYPMEQVSESGLLTVSIRDLYQKQSAFPSHLKQWLDGAGDELGPERLRYLLKVFIYRELALKRRYFQKIKRKVEKLDYAFGMFLYGDVERTTKQKQNVEKIRKYMASRLKKCKAAAEDQLE